jgi:amino-acid N-acetyltransferase
MNLLAACSLPNSDISAKNLQHFFGCGEESNPGGVVGVELYGDIALLRSLAVHKDARGKGCGKRLVQEVEQYAQRSGAKRLYLLTTTAETFFEGLKYVPVSRESLPEAIRSTTQFSSLCSTSATVMFKVL